MVIDHKNEPVVESVVFATAEAAPIARVGGLAEASAGLIRSLRATTPVDLTVVLPDYGDAILEDETTAELDLPEWVGPATLRSGIAPELGEVHLVGFPAMTRKHPYVDEYGEGWSDNDLRFFGFSAGVAAITNDRQPDVVHLNDWHTAMASAWIDTPSVYTIHTLGYQGHADISWLDVIAPERREAFERFGEVNPAAAAIQTANQVIAVSPNYASEILDPTRGAGLADLLAERGDDLVGIRNGIDANLWNPLTDPNIAARYGRTNLGNKEETQAQLRALAGWEPNDGPIIGMVTRLVEQKGIDIMLGLVPYLEHMGARLVMLGSGAELLSMWARQLEVEYPDQFAFIDGYDLKLAHQIFAGADLFCMPSRFEPCGLAQMQAMRYGTIPVVTPVGGLVDTVIDADHDQKNGTGFVALTVDAIGMLDALHRAVGAWRVRRRRVGIQKRGMAIDWSWDGPTQQHLSVYQRAMSKARS